jgi:hypothetical protein
MMTLQSNVSLQWPSLVSGQVAHELTDLLFNTKTSRTTTWQAGTM